MLIDLGSRFRIKSGLIVMEMKHNNGMIEHREDHNVIVDDASLQMAQWAIQDDPSTVAGIMRLAVGVGDPGWDLQNPPVATAAQHTLVNEIARASLTKNYVDPITFLPSVTRTNIVDFQAIFTETQAVGALVEQGLFGGGLNPSTGFGYSVANGGTQINYYTMPVWNKPSTATLTITWRLTF